MVDESELLKKLQRATLTTTAPTITSPRVQHIQQNHTSVEVFDTNSHQSQPPTAPQTAARQSAPTTAILMGEMGQQRNSGFGFGDINKSGTGYVGTTSEDWWSNGQHSGGQMSAGAPPYVPPRPQRSPTPPQGAWYSGEEGIRGDMETGTASTTREAGVAKFTQIISGRALEAMTFKQTQGSVVSDIDNNPSMAHRGTDSRINVPEFDGKSDANAFIDWLKRVDKILTFKKYVGQRAVSLVETKLIGYALNWWESVQQLRASVGDKYATDWEVMREEMMARFISSTYEEESFAKLQTLQQSRTRTVDDYASGFYMLSHALSYSSLKHSGVYFISVGVEFQSDICYIRYMPTGLFVAPREKGRFGCLLTLQNLEKSTKDGILGTASTPIPMMTPAGSLFTNLLWNIFHAVALGFVLISGVGALIKYLGIDKVLSLNEVRSTYESNTKFSDVKGVDEAKAELEEIVHYLRDPRRGRSAILLVCNGSEFEEIFVGVGAQMVRNLFAAAKKQSPCIIFLDEIDAIGGSRSAKDQKYMKMALNQLFVELDGFEHNEGIIVIAATNFPESLDKALMRPGRFDRNIVIPNPDIEGRRQILESHMSKVLQAENVDLMIIARGTRGFSGADLANLVNIAAVKAAMYGADAVTMSDLEYAKDKIVMGSERKSAVISKKSRKIIAFHEAGHALVAIYTEGALAVHMAAIVPRGKSLGMVSQLSDKNETSILKKQMLARLNVSMGGWVAEELIFGEEGVTSGASSDLQKATSLARAMVTKYGMSKEIGLCCHDYKDNGRRLSPETKLLIEKEVNKLLDTAYSNAKNILTTHKKEHYALANALLKHDTLTASQIKGLLAQVNSQKKQKEELPVSPKTSPQSSPVPPSSTSDEAALAAATSSNDKNISPVGS
ncbi:hypothetical protein GIB67_041603 [Kingdonia uniflora]|uniref:AAA+ ATPase domain-containing protein n=1 Tax=Kingdonia uniflora TaxID=39325 RepID=A0A7J7MQU5_9MAGN|nr:hypothetical protein GIB67_041603 [Kingdonia uniflora]